MTRVVGRSTRKIDAAASRCLWHERKRRQHVFELLDTELIQGGDPRLQSGMGGRVVPPRQHAARARRSLRSRAGAWSRVRHRQPLDDRGRDVRRDAQPHQVVQDEAVEQAAEQLLIGAAPAASSGRTPCASRRSRRKNRPQSASAVRRARDVSIRKARPFSNGHRGADAARRAPRIDHRLASTDPRANGSICLPSTTGNPFPGPRNDVAILGRVQLPAEPAPHPRSLAERRGKRAAARSAIGEIQRQRGARNREIVARDPPDDRAGS